MLDASASLLDAHSCSTLRERETPDVAVAIGEDFRFDSSTQKWATGATATGAAFSATRLQLMRFEDSRSRGWSRSRRLREDLALCRERVAADALRRFPQSALVPIAPTAGGPALVSRASCS
jgi:hypothetical protein